MNSSLLRMNGAHAGRVIVSSSLWIHQGQQKCLQTSNLAGRVLTINSNQTEGWWGREGEAWGETPGTWWKKITRLLHAHCPQAASCKEQTSLERQCGLDSRRPGPFHQPSSASIGFFIKIPPVQIYPYKQDSGILRARQASVLPKRLSEEQPTVRASVDECAMD